MDLQGSVNNQAKNDSSTTEQACLQWEDGIQTREFGTTTLFWRELRKETMDLIVQHLGDERKLDRACFEMAVKGEAGCDIVCDENLKQNLRELWMRKLRQHGSVLEALDYRAPGQPFYLRLFKELLAFSGDVDRDFLLQGETGYPVGVDLPLPRTPHVFEEQTSWKLENDPHMQEEIWRSNYQSVEAHKDFVRQHFEEECAEGLMEKLTIEEAKAKYGKRIAISSLAVLVEENHQGKRRVIHDATHGTRIKMSFLFTPLVWSINLLTYTRVMSPVLLMYRIYLTIEFLNVPYPF